MWICIGKSSRKCRERLLCRVFQNGERHQKKMEVFPHGEIKLNISNGCIICEAPMDTKACMNFFYFLTLRYFLYICVHHSSPTQAHLKRVILP
ncbi:hypothetical protein PCYB_081450, partial [Plasmodium cynomolgi strain B]